MIMVGPLKFVRAGVYPFSPLEILVGKSVIQTERQTDRETDRQIDRQTERKTDRQTDRQVQYRY